MGREKNKVEIGRNNKKRERRGNKAWVRYSKIRINKNGGWDEMLRKGKGEKTKERQRRK